MTSSADAGQRGLRVGTDEAFEAQAPNAWIRDRDKLRKELINCLTVGDPSAVNLSNHSHTAITTVLREFAYDGAWKDKILPSVFMDTSKPAPFALGSLTQVPEPVVFKRYLDSADGSRPSLRLGLMSFRHPEMDFLVDLYVLRNVEVNSEPSFAAQEAIAFKKGIELLTDPCLRDGGVIEVLHTGLEPMVVGFYRAVTAALAQREEKHLPRSLVIRPGFFNGTRAKPPFNRASSGAKINDYLFGKAWW